MGQPLSSCSPNHIDPRQAYEEYQRAKLCGKQPENPFCCRYRPELEHQREQLEKEKFRRQSKGQTHIPSTPQSPKDSSTPPTIVRQDRVSNGALIQQSKRSKSKTKSKSKQMKQNKPYYPPPPQRHGHKHNTNTTPGGQDTHTPTSFATNVTDPTSEVQSLSLNERQPQSPDMNTNTNVNVTVVSNDVDDIFELEMSGSASELFDDDDTYSEPHSTKVSVNGFIQSESLVITTCDDLYQHPLMVDDDSNASRSLTTSPTSMIATG
eukprot:CAMPEP_0201593498 /NCGR_PEP_ID=MMETSP0190_2-20130828/191083_1 /ASSEMBLY_ACC=CAM_ASM_000263 /TAXON_ID=37353 /ORGANISM="Rosalina sp." /LENGTH=264 /DNA_ID=CAMNT_0048052705 /DNA_START=36 /DNA_END=827 /DNA_ORIENTATION=-